MNIKSLKVAVTMVAVLALFLVAVPVAAQEPQGRALWTGACAFTELTQLVNLWFTPPNCPEPPPWQGIWWHDRWHYPYVVRSGTNEDPFGGLPINGATSSRAPGITEKFGIFSPQGVPFGTSADDINGPRPDIRGAWLPGGVPGRLSGDGSNPRKAINISGAWAAASDPRFAGTDSSQGERPPEIPTCWTGKIAAGTSKWFKAETWKNKKLYVWLDDELDTATKPSGSAVFGAADQYMVGTTEASIWTSNEWVQNGASTRAIQRFNTQRDLGPELEGYVMFVHDPNALRPNFAFEPPNAAILTVGVWSTGSLHRSPPGARGVSIYTIEGRQLGFGQYNPSQPAHLLWFEGHWDGWAFVRVYNQMLWDGTATVCSYRAFWK